MKPGELLAQISAMVGEVSQMTGLEALKVRYLKEHNRRILRVTINREGGISLDDCERFSKALSRHLDDQDLIPEKYYLEVESPGI